MCSNVDEYPKEFPCRYIYTSSFYYRRFIRHYNSGIYREISISLSEFYKAWDTLFQAMILMSGHPIREINEKIVKEYPLGNIYSLTNFLNELKKVNPTNVELKGIKLAYSHFDDWLKPKVRADIYSAITYNLLDFLREVRNAEQHDIIEQRGTYASLIDLKNPIVQELIDRYIIAYEQTYMSLETNSCSQVVPPKDDKNINKHRRTSTFCNFKLIKRPTFLKSLSHIPSFSTSKNNQAIVKDSTSLDRLWSILIEKYKTTGRNLK